MPRDFAILAKFDPVGRSKDFLKAVGKTDFVFSVFDNDVQKNNANQLRVVEGTDKLVQSVLKIILTKQGENFEDPNYGVENSYNIGDKLVQDIDASVRSGIINALAYYNLLNQDNDNLDEVIGSVSEVRVLRDEKEPRAVLIYISLVTASGKTVQIIVPQVE